MTEPLKLTFRPGINRDSTDYGNTGGWYDINLARWVSGTPQSMGGWRVGGWEALSSTTSSKSTAAVRSRTLLIDRSTYSGALCVSISKLTNGVI